MNYLNHIVKRLKRIMDRYPPRAKRLVREAEFRAEQDERLEFIKGQIVKILDLLDEASGDDAVIEGAARRAIAAYIAAAECSGHTVDRFWLERYPNLTPKWY